MVSESAAPPPSVPVRFFYIKANHFSVYHVDGALGGITPRGLIHFAVYSERPAIPQSGEHTFSPEGVLSPPLSLEGKAGIVRELDADLIMSKATAVEIRNWLTGRIEELDALERGEMPHSVDPNA
jgi:hypothetical protein